MFGIFARKPKAEPVKVRVMSECEELARRQMAVKRTVHISRRLAGDAVTWQHTTELERQNGLTSR